VSEYAKAPNSSFPVCNPMNGRPPAHYGDDAPLAGVLEHVRKNPLVLPDK
jgi:hypothetical protein